MDLPLPSPIAQVYTPQGANWYIAQAQQHQGFVVQRRYRGVGAPYYTHEYPGNNQGRIWRNCRQVAPRVMPFLNPGAVRAVGLTTAAVYRWAAAHPGEIFSHPTYAPLCLRWGANPFGYGVEELVEPTLSSNAVPFTPHTCWQSGTTYYQLVLAPASEEPAIVDVLRAQAGLRIHDRELGWEGTWSGWYTTDRPAVERSLASRGQYMALAQPHLHYGVWLESAVGSEEHQVVAWYATAEEAQAHFLALPEDPVPTGGHFNYPRVAVNSTVQWPGQGVRHRSLCDKALWPGAADSLLLRVEGTGTSWMASPTSMASGNIDELEYPLPALVPTLANRLAATGFSRREVANSLRWTPEKLHEREQDPTGLTLHEMEQLAVLTKQTVPQLLSELRQEAQARAMGNRLEPVQVPHGFGREERILVVE